MHIQGHILDVFCTSKSLTSSVHHCVKDGISYHLDVFFTTTLLVKNSCRVKLLKIRKLSKINKTEFMSDIANSELIQALTKQPVYNHTSIVIPLETYLTSTQLYMNVKLHNMSTKGS